MEAKNIYIKAEQCVEVHNKKIYIDDILKIYGDDKKLVKDMKGEVLLTVTEEKKTKYIFSILKIIEVLTAKHPGVNISSLGEKDIIVEYMPPSAKKKFIEYAKIVFVCLATFFGAAFTIMTFNEDVSVSDVFNMIYRLVKMEEPSKGGILQLSYTAGLPIGIAAFFNHFSKVKMSSDPTPLQVELRLYESDVNKSIIQNASREGKEKDV